MTITLPRKRMRLAAALASAATGLILSAALGQTVKPILAPGGAADGVRNLVTNPGFEVKAGAKELPEGYELTGAARWIFVGYPDEIVTPGVTLESYDAKGGKPSGSVSQLVRNIDPKNGKWLRFTFRGLAEDGFRVEKDQLAMKLEFFGKNGANALDSAERLIYREVEKDRKHFTINGDYGKAGAAVWRTYEFEELLPFPEVDAVRVSVLFKNGAGTADKNAAFFVDDFSLTQHMKSSRGLVDPADAKKPAASGPAPVEAGMIPLGGRWYYQPGAGEAIPVSTSGRLAGTLKVTETNAHRLFFRDDRLMNPFAGNMSAWLRKGYLDVNGALVTKDRFVPDSVTLTFDGGPAVQVRARNIPNHPTAKFPDTYGTQGYNPSYIQEHDDTYYLPLEPEPNPQATALDPRTANGALPMGPVGVAVNGVVFFNPYDANMTDATSIMDRCCGHPSPDYRYHYHKYPICVNTPFVDKGEGHSAVLGFAFDGMPMYGPYESAGVMAKDSMQNPLNAFNAHQDAVRGWHYHVTPGKFPYLLGGYFGKVDARNFQRRGPRGGGPGRGRPMGGPGLPPG